MFFGRSDQCLSYNFDVPLFQISTVLSCEVDTVGQQQFGIVPENTKKDLYLFTQILTLVVGFPTDAVDSGKSIDLIHVKFRAELHVGFVFSPNHGTYQGCKRLTMRFG